MGSVDSASPQELHVRSLCVEILEFERCVLIPTCLVRGVFQRINQSRLATVLLDILVYCRSQSTCDRMIWYLAGLERHIHVRRQQELQLAAIPDLSKRMQLLEEALA